jgi:hypothetical protein
VAEEDGGGVIPSPVELPLKAIVRIRIPLKRPPEKAKDSTIDDNNTD